ncbi:MAG: tail fiber domain-containing protein [Bacteroidia bacterium]|nr:tail fiber domain-containing protein [Bacteroidia bacterium]
MKTKLSFLFLLSFVFYLSYSQVPQGFNYQAVARKTSGEPVVNTSLPVMMTIQADSAGSTVIWKELHSSVTSNGEGVINLVIGKGVKQSGTASTFSAIEWSITPKFIKTEIDYNGWKTMGVTRLWSVPYAMTAGGSGAPFKKLSVNGETAINDEALFEVKNKDGNTVFAVYNEGVRVYVSDGEKGLKGGFAVGGFGTDKAESQKYLVVSKDSVRIYLDTNPATKKLKGGFAVGGYDMTKGTSVEDYLQVTRDSTRIYVKENAGKKLKGGFAVGGFDVTKGIQNITPFTSLTSDNYFIGHEAGLANTTGKYNSFFGYRAGRSNTTGNMNIFLGMESGFSNKNGWGNLFIGDSAGFENTSGYFNVFLGQWAGQQNTIGYYNISLGNGAGAYNQTGWQNINLGMQAGFKNITGSRNVNVGTGAGESNIIGSFNVLLGNLAGQTAYTGDANVYLGAYSGRYNLTGSGNVFIGYGAGRDEMNSQRLYIANSATTTPLIFGEFDNHKVVINGNSGHNWANRTFFVNGTAGGLAAWYNDSDMRLKHDVISIPDALQKVLKLRGVNFLWNNPSEGMEGLQMGFIGQEAYEVVPEVVTLRNDRFSMQYAPITALLVEAVKEQQSVIEKQQAEIERLRALETEVSELRDLVKGFIK